MNWNNKQIIYLIKTVRRDNEARCDHLDESILRASKVKIGLRYRSLRDVTAGNISRIY